MRKELLLIGRGGQGVLLLGHIVGLAAAKYEGIYVTTSEFYSAETRGGESRAEIILADSEDELDYLRVRSADIVLALYPPNLGSVTNLISGNALIFADSTFQIDRDALPEGARVVSAPYTKLAGEVLNTTRVANLIALGHLISVTSILRKESVERAIEEAVRKEWVELNRKAFNYGLRLR